jgi:hypothetical protein
MHRSIARAVVSVAFAALASLAACGGDSSGLFGPGDDDGGATNVNDASAGNDGESASDATPSIDSPAMLTDGPTGCAASASRAACIMCCDSTNAAGLQALVGAELMCACDAQYCGPIEGGVPADAGSGLGSGACARTCTAHTAPSSACRNCVDLATGTARNKGPCYAAVTKACMQNTDCVAYARCVASCPN